MRPTLDEALEYVVDDELVEVISSYVLVEHSVHGTSEFSLMAQELQTLICARKVLLANWQHATCKAEPLLNNSRCYCRSPHLVSEFARHHSARRDNFFDSRLFALLRLQF